MTKSIHWAPTLIWHLTLDLSLYIGGINEGQHSFKSSFFLEVQKLCVEICRMLQLYLMLLSRLFFSLQRKRSKRREQVYALFSNQKFTSIKASVKLTMWFCSYNSVHSWSCLLQIFFELILSACCPSEAGSLQ